MCVILRNSASLNISSGSGSDDGSGVAVVVVKPFTCSIRHYQKTLFLLV